MDASPCKRGNPTLMRCLGLFRRQQNRQHRVDCPYVDRPHVAVPRLCLLVAYDTRASKLLSNHCVLPVPGAGETKTVAACLLTIGNVHSMDQSVESQDHNVRHASSPLAITRGAHAELAAPEALAHNR